MFHAATPEVDSLEETRPTRELLALVGGACADCSTKFTARDGVYNIVLGFKKSARCLNCLCQRLQRTPVALHDQMREFVQRQECYRRAWQVAEELDAAAETTVRAETALATYWDAEDLACGELLLALSARLRSLPRGSVLTLRATDPAAPEDLPAWCRLCGHALEFADHPRYEIRRKDA